MRYDTLTLELDGAIARVWLDRPAKLNALNPQALEDICAVFGELQRRFETPVVVLGGRGRAFCAGADRSDPPARLGRGSGAGPRERRWTSQLGRRALEAIEHVEAITIARLHGHVIGGGLSSHSHVTCGSRRRARPSGSRRSTSASRSPGAPCRASRAR
jgi:enoyl-CoA hydratase/carnithine racemase